MGNLKCKLNLIKEITQLNLKNQGVDDESRDGEY